MKNLILLISLSCGVMACNSSQKEKNTQNVALVEKYVQAVENKDYETMSSCLADDYLGVGPSYGDTVTKAQASENWKYNVENLYDKIKYNKSKVVPVSIPDGPNKGEWVSNWSELTISYKNGKSVTIWANTSYLIENDKIIRSFTLYNEADVLRQLGFQFIGPDVQ